MKSSDNYLTNKRTAYECQHADPYHEKLKEVENPI